jgi:Anti-sigma factor NepR
MNKDCKTGLDGKPIAASDAAHGTTEPEVDHEPMLDQAIQQHLGRKLQATYNDLVSQPVPDKFRQLLDELERQEKKQ